MTPNDFTTAATAWIAAVVSIAAIVIPAYVKIKGMIDSLGAAHLENKARIDLHDKESGITTTATTTTTGSTTSILSTSIPTQGTGSVNPAPVGPLPDPKSFRQPLGQPQKPSA